MSSVIKIHDISLWRTSRHSPGQLKANITHHGPAKPSKCLFAGRWRTIQLKIQSSTFPASQGIWQSSEGPSFEAGSCGKDQMSAGCLPELVDFFSGSWILQRYLVSFSCLIEVIPPALILLPADSTLNIQASKEHSAGGHDALCEVFLKVVFLWSSPWKSVMIGRMYGLLEKPV